MKTSELQQKLAYLEKRYDKTGRAIERTKAEIAEVEKLAALKSNLVIEIAGLRFAKVNLGTDLENPYGKHYTHEEALESCTKGWRLPTDEEHEQLHERTTQEVVARDGIRGMLFTDKDTNVEMFLPCAGYRSYSSSILINIGYSGYFWSSSRHATAHYAYNLDFNATGWVSPSNNYNRSNGFSVRCIEE